MSRINMIKVSKEGTKAVCDYVYNKVNRRGLGMHYETLIRQETQTLKNWEKLVGSVVEKTADECAAQQAVIDALKAEKVEQCKKYAYVATEADKAFRKDMKNGRDVYATIKDWFYGNLGYSEELSDNEFLETLVTMSKRPDYKVFNDTEGVSVMGINATALLAAMYFISYEKLVGVKYVKAVDVPTPMKKYYEDKAAKAAAKRTKKAAK